MIDALAAAIALAALGGAVAIAATAVSGRFRWRTAAPSLVVLEAALVAQAALDALGLVGGHELPSVPTHLAYLATSVLVLPAAVTQVRGADGRWAGALLAATLLLLAVLIVRLQTTWRSGG